VGCDHDRHGSEASHRPAEAGLCIRPIGDAAGWVGTRILGLSITAAIAEDHGGTIEVTSEVGRGTTFTVVLPVVVVPRAAAA
ncbi:MAG: ATP-binding protein, partial [Gaiellaceae bacterium]